MFSAHYVFHTDFCNVASGNEKGFDKHFWANKIR